MFTFVIATNSASKTETNNFARNYYGSLCSPQGIFWAQCFACEDHLRDFSFDHGPCSGEDCILETFFGDPRIANEPLHLVAVVLTIIKLSSKVFKPV